MNKLKKVKYLVVHHSQRKNNNSLQKIKKAHLKRGFEDIGYHYLITKTGKIIQGRSEKFQGAHVYNHNKNSIGICLTGNFDLNKPSKKQIESLVQILKKKIKKHKVLIKNILGHREFPKITKTCPGRFVDMNEIRNKLKQKHL